ncbi:MAG: phosphoribosylglycinamide formyltransferase, partial [Candidatus Adiutrix sp.]|nr:phosphoribosylglycinamide formyltransferase [Candidatus Adiutrix sp.]
MKPLRLGVLVSGRGSNLKAILDEIEAGRLAAEAALVISDNPEAGAVKLAEGRGISSVVVERTAFREKDAFESALVSLLESRQVELVVLAGFMRVLGRRFIEEAPGRVINIHPSLLPSFPGLKAQKQALDHGVKISGCTVHFVNEIMDGGRIIAQAAVPVHPDDTEETLSARILAEEHRLLPRVIGWIAEALRAPDQKQ